MIGANARRWDETGFEGVVRLDRHRTVVGRVALEPDRIVLEWDYYGCHPAPAVVEAQGDWRALLPRVRFSPGYGLLE
jgi:hypothetical protein